MIVRLQPGDGPYRATSVSMREDQVASVDYLAHRYGLARSAVMRELLDDALAAGEAIIEEAMEQSPREEVPLPHEITA